MRFNCRALWVAGSVFSALGFVASISADDAISIASPGAGAVGRFEEVMIKSASNVRPVLLVRADAPGNEWWVQRTAEPAGAGQFKALAQFGNAATRQGTKFQLIAVVPRDEVDAGRYEVGGALKNIPTGAQKSAEVKVTLNVAKSGTPSPVGGVSTAFATGVDVFVEPADKGNVEQIQEIVGKSDCKGRPVVMVRPDDRNSPWYVQEESQPADEGRFTARVRFGNDATPNGTKFRLIVLLPEDNAQADQFEVGATVRQLPKDVPHSKEISVVLQREQ